MATTPTTAPPPAYASAPRRSALIYALAAIVALAAVVAIAWIAFGPGRTPAPERPGTGPVAGVTDAQQAVDAAKAALDQASRNVLQPPPSSLPPVAAPAVGTPPADAVAPAAAPPPRTAATTEAPRTAVRPAPASPPPMKAPATPPPTAAIAPPAAPAAAVAAPPVQVATADRWRQMHDEMERCSSASVIPRIQCQQRIRVRYCDGFWGSVPDCPTGNRRGG